MSNTRHARPRGRCRYGLRPRRGASPPIVQGATAIEYGIMTLIAIAIMALVSQIGGSVSGMFEMLKNAFG